MAAPPPPAPDYEPFLSGAVLPPDWQIVYEPVVTSTNDLAREAAERGWPERSVFVADYQTSGRGRQGRVWVAPPRTCVLASLLFRHGSQAPQFYTMLTSVSASEAIERLLGLEVAVKWPNDLMVEDRKAAGVLAEAVSGAQGAFVIVGLGINANLSMTELERLPSTATSLRHAAGRDVHRGELLVALIEHLDAWLRLPGERRWNDLWRAWHARLWGRNQVLRISEGEGHVEGVVEGALPDGTLLVRRADGRISRVVAGEIIL
jgi:BirA family biotin operon repressor/biotin-[acetyl-CoA-carboxylase] ligase